jgi:hypothetical protein
MLKRLTWLICAYFFGLGAIAGPMVILGWQAYTWLRSGFWPSLPVVAVANAMNMRLPQVEAVELQPIIASVYACPLSLALFTTFIAISVCMFSRVR